MKKYLHKFVLSVCVVVCIVLASGSCVTPGDIDAINTRIATQTAEVADTNARKASGEITAEQAAKLNAESIAETKRELQRIKDEAVARGEAYADSIKRVGSDPSTLIAYIVGLIGTGVGALQTKKASDEKKRADAERIDRREAERKAVAIDIQATDDHAATLEERIKALERPKGA